METEMYEGGKEKNGIRDGKRDVRATDRSYHGGHATLRRV